MSSPKVQLVIGGQVYGGWTTARVTRSIEAMCGSFELELFDRWDTQQQRWPVRGGSKCALLLGGTPVITGVIDKWKLGLKGVTASVRGRDITSYLVDCSCRLNKWEFVAVHTLAFVRKVCAPYGLTVRLDKGIAESSVLVSKKMSIEPGDTAAQAIENACRIAGLLAMPDGLGNLLLTRAGTSRASTALVEGVNILEGTTEHDLEQRFNTVHVLGEKPGTDQVSGTGVMSLGTATDPEIDPKRVTYVRAEGAVSWGQAKKRAQWEVAVRAARSHTASIKVAGWKQADGALWALNQLVHVTSPRLELDDDLLIGGTTMTLSRDGGTVTELALKPANAFVPQPTPFPMGLWADISGGA